MMKLRWMEILYQLGGSYLVKYVLQFILRQSTALDIFHCTELLCQFISIAFLYRVHHLFRQLVFYV